MKRFVPILPAVYNFRTFFATNLLLTAIFGFAQENTFYHYGLNEGLSQESVMVILKDTQGFLWLGTQDGLNRFDGNRFKVYKSEIGNDKSISGNFINELLEADSLIWVGTSNNGVSCYNKKLNNFRSVGKRNSNCTALTKDKNGNIYAAYLDNGLSEFSLVDDSLKERKVDFFEINNLKLTSAAISDDQKLYVGSKTGRLFRADSSKKPLHFEEVVLGKGMDEINKIFIEDDRVWLGTTSGLFSYQFHENKFTPIDIEKYSPNATEKQTIFDIAKRNDNYYVATDNGLFVLSQLDDKQKSFSNCNIFNGDKNNRNSITSNRVYDLLFDDDLLWIGTNKLDVLSLSIPVFKTINSTTKTAINNNHVFSIYKNDEYLFIGTRDGLNCIDQNGKVTLITKENTEKKLAYNVIRGIAQDADDKLWLATTKGVSVIDMVDFNPERPKVKSLFFDQSDSTSLSNNNTRSVFVDRQNQVWIMTYGGGINRFTGNLDANIFSFQHFVDQNDTNSLSSDLTYNMSQDENNNYWVTTNSGLNKLSFKNNDFEKPVFKVYLKGSNEPEITPSTSILTVFHDKGSILWIGTSDGFYKFDKKTEDFKLYSKKEGLTNSVVYSILEDPNDMLWLSTNSGLFQFDKTSETFSNFSVSDGLQSLEFNLGGHFKDRKTNELYFGGINGVNHFNADDIDKLYKEGNLLFTAMQIKGEDITPELGHEIIDVNITYSQSVNLKYNEFPCYLAFSDLNFSRPQNSQFVFKLFPNDMEWNDLNDRKEIQLLNLSAGDYTVLVQGKLRNKLWEKDPLQIQLRVSPPWYRSKLAYFLYALLTLSLFLFINRFMLRRRYEQQEVARLKELDQLKTKLYTNITHEFRTPITVILGMARTIRDTFSDTAIKADDQLEMIERNSNNLLSLVNQILDLSKLEKGKLDLNLRQDDIIVHLKYLTESFLSLAEEKQIALTFYNEENEIVMDYDIDKISQIVTNLISNAIKFCGKNDKIIIHVSKNVNDNPSQLILKIKDTGIGISKENLPFIFDRFYQVDNHVDGKHAGTGIGLALTQELVLLMNGEITVKSKEGFGTTFTVKLPIFRNANLSESFESEAKQQIRTSGAPILKIKDTPSNLPIALIVEDNIDVASYIVTCLENKYQIIYAENGQKGIEMAKEEIPDIIVSDIMMPKKNGLELCENLKQDIKTNHIPIILLTAKASLKDRLSGLGFGADAYLVKPFYKEELLIRAEKLIALRSILQQKYQDATSWSVDSKKVSQTFPDKNDVFINKVIEVINENLDNSDFDGGRLANALCLSESQLYRKLKALTNTSTAIFIRKVRLQKARQLISSSDLTVSEVAYSTGFNDPSWFSKSFKAEFGHSPSEKR
ncbi:MAG: response regulator [Pricia sp.]|nr:response regulator [Pricia sp.]